MVWLMGPDGQPLWFNRATLTFAGTEDREAIAAKWLDGIFPEDRERFRETWEKGRREREKFALEYRRRDGSGDYHRLAVHATPLRDADGEFRGFICLASDLTASLLSESSSSAGVIQVELLSQVTHDVVWDWDLRTDMVICNAAFIEMLGEPPHDYAGAHAWWRSRAHPDDIQRIVDLYDVEMKAGSTSVSYEYRIRDAADQWITLDSRVRLIREATGEIVRVLVASRDITKRREAEEAQDRLIRIIEATSDYVGVGTTDGQPLYINAAGRKLIGLEPDEPLPAHISESHPEWANEILLNEGIPTAIREGSWQGENAMLHRDGHEIPVSQSILVHRGADGQAEFISTIIRDISGRKREEIERIEWANRYDAAIRASGQVLFDWNSFNNDITYAGDVERLFGYTVKEMAGGLERLRQVIDPKDLARFDQQVHQSTATRDPFNMEFLVCRKDGRQVHVEAKGYFFLDRRGQIGRMVGFFADVTTERAAQEALASAHDNLEQRVANRTAELARASAMIENRAHRQEVVAQLGQRALTGAPLAKLMAEAMRVIAEVLRVDRAALLALTHDGRELVVRSFHGWPEALLGTRIPVGRQSQSGYTLFTGEPVIMDDAATERRFTCSEPILDAKLTSGLTVLIKGADGPLGVLAVFTALQRAFMQEDVHFLQSVANVLSATIQRERAEESIRQAREQAELASRAKSEFLSRMSHELRTPLNAILGFTQLMEIETLAPGQAESVQHISRAGKHLLSLINEVLDISRIDAGRFALTPEPVEVFTFIEDAIAPVRGLAARHNVEILFDEGDEAAKKLHVHADRSRLHQVMLNLLSNAVKYNHAGGKVTVSYREDGPNVRMTVSDTGQGIAPDKIARLFLPFERLGAESTDVEGSGIGLALSRGIVTALQGVLSVESRVGEGSTFWVSLPRIEAPVTAAPTEGETAAASPAAPGPPKPIVARHRHTLLYIEDQDLNLRLVERILNPRPEYRLLTALQGGAGLNLAREQQPDLILLDLNLPDMTGDEVLHRLKADPAIRHIPVIMVSADAMGDRIEHLLRLGASGYLTKPYKLDQFLKVIQEALPRPE